MEQLGGFGKPWPRVHHRHDNQSCTRDCQDPHYGDRGASRSDDDSSNVAAGVTDQVMGP